jgi:isopropylmalate/homocitrate/citramalate synthase
MSIPDEVTIYEVGPRDGLQNEDVLVPTEAKIRLVEQLSDAGLPMIEVTSFVSPRAVPQLADAEDVMRAISRRPGVLYPVLVPNEKGLARAVAAGADAIAVFAAATDAFSSANINMSVEESLDAVEPVLEQAEELDMWRRGYVSVAFGCPYQGPVEESEVARVAGALFALGCEEVSIGDTIGVATPDDVRRVVEAVLEEVPIDRVALHLHDTQGMALANVEAGLDLGVSVFDSAVGGTGGCPFAPGAPGNLATEALVELLERNGIEHGVDAERLVDIANSLHEVLAR